MSSRFSKYRIPAKRFSVLDGALRGNARSPLRLAMQPLLDRSWQREKKAAFGQPMHDRTLRELARSNRFKSICAEVGTTPRKPPLLHAGQTNPHLTLYPFIYGFTTRNPMSDLPETLPSRYPGTDDALLLDALQNGRPEPMVHRGDRFAGSYLR